MAKASRYLDVEIVSLGADGLGVARNADAHVRVKGVVPGEALQVRVAGRRGRTRFAIPVRWQRVSHRRHEPPCRSFLACGGCTVQQLEPERQLALKDQWLQQQLESEGVTPKAMSPAVAGPTLLYRRKARLAARFLASEDELLLGFRESFSNKIVRMDGCVVLAEPFSSAFPVLKRTLGALSVRHAIPQVELAVGDDRAVAVVRHLEPLEPADVDRLWALEADIGGEVLLQPRGADSITTLAGTPAALQSYRIDGFGVSLEFHPNDFVQVNRTINERIVSAAVTALDPRPGERVLDLFCGLGNFSLPLARRGARVLGLEAAAGMVNRARHNAERNALAHRAAFEVADLYADPITDARSCTRVLLDPPRSGCGPSIAGLADPAIERVVYVSCEPRTLAADAASLTRAGYDLSRVGVFDMFPHTAHVETLGVFDRR